ncbi:MAG: DNA cytosine methyltransferase [Coriobacteriia bacterium]|nr:DNA cytosine methyltransferase [Coriobacteriia bacterium]
MKGLCIQLSQPRVAEFFAGIGLVGHALEREGCKVIFANDIDPVKHRLFADNYDDSVFTVGDIRDIHGHHVPDVDIATASFPCTDLSLAGNRAGLTGDHSGMFWQFTRILDEMGHRRPRVVMLENVVGFFSSNGGKDLRAAIEELNALGYRCDLVLADARWFVPQSRPRVFIVGSSAPLPANQSDTTPAARPSWFAEFASQNPDLMLQEFPVRLPATLDVHLSSVVDRISDDDSAWWDAQRTKAFVDSLSPLQGARVEELRCAPAVEWRTAYRRTRNGVPVWEVRRDAIAGCLRTARGGSSKQAVVQAGAGGLRIRWMSAREYARLQGVPDYRLDSVTESQALFGFGDAVCVPVVQWIGREYLLPALAAAVRERLVINEGVPVCSGCAAL